MAGQVQASGDSRPPLKAYIPSVLCAAATVFGVYCSGSAGADYAHNAPYTRHQTAAIENGTMISAMLGGGIGAAGGALTLALWPSRKTDSKGKEPA